MTRPIPLTARSVREFRPPVAEGATRMEGDSEVPLDIVFHLREPTYQQRDTIGSILFSHGLVPVTQEQSRAVLISELYDFYAAKDPETSMVPAGKMEGDPDEIASFLEGYWQQAELYQGIVQEWAIQEKERIFDELKGAPPRDPLPYPKPPFSTRDTARAQRIATEMLDYSESYRILQARFGEEQSLENLMLFRVFTAGWEGLQTMLCTDKMGKLTEATVEALRGELEALGLPSVYGEVVQELRNYFGVDKVTEKNFESPLGTGSSPSGSLAQSAELDSGAGSSTESNIEPTPPSGSTATSATSSTSRSGRGKRTSKSSRTAAH